MSYRKVGGLHFIKIGRFGASFYASRSEGSFAIDVPSWQAGTLGVLAAMIFVAM